MATGLNVVALISGGKDSLFSILHCIANGHNVVALANLYPSSQADPSLAEDTDSFMYQTVGHAVIPMYEHVLGLPLYRQEIVGTAINHDKSYGYNATGPDSDETESLMPLLQRVVIAHPEVNAVSTGAILSDYQRTRVESIARRLKLTPLSYLWQYPVLPPHSESSLLHDMLAVGQDSRLIKVASGGLDESFLWQNVAHLRTISRLSKAVARFGNFGDGALLGEGGEYETLAVSGPPPLWKGEIVIADSDRKPVKGEAGTFSLQVQNVSFVPFQIPPNVKDEPQVRMPALFDYPFEALLNEFISDTYCRANDQGLCNLSSKSGQLTPRSTNETLLMVPNTVGGGQDATEQTISILNSISATLASHGHEMNDIVYTSIIVRNMADFIDINAVYGAYFSQPNPPARVTVGSSAVLGAQDLLTIAVTSSRKDKSVVKTGLHVQSRSYWAPANIGPYSQAISTVTTEQAERPATEIVYVAGQIPLVPASMEIYTHPSGDVRHQFIGEAVLSLQHLFRIKARVNIRRFLAVIAFVMVNDKEDSIVRADLLRRIWHLCHARQIPLASEPEESADVDVWDLQNRVVYGSDDSTQLETSLLQHASETAGVVPPIIVIRVDELPRGAQVEWAGYGTTGSEDCDETISHLQLLLKTFQSQILG